MQSSINLPGAFWVALLLGLNEALQTLDLGNAPIWATVAVFVVAALAKAVQEEARDKAGADEVHAMGQRRRPYLMRVLLG